MPPPTEIIPKEVLLRILREAVSDLEWKPASDVELEVDQESGRRQVAFEAMRFVAAAAAWQPLPEAVPWLVRAIPHVKGHRIGIAAWDIEMLGKGIGALIAMLDRATPELELLAKSKSPSVRVNLAGALKPLDDERIALLRRLARDRNTDVREAARESLGSEHAPPWWEGVLPDDPLAALSVEEAAELRPGLERVVALLQLSGHRLKGHAEELVRLIEALPEELMVKVIRAFFRREDSAGKRLPGMALGRLLLERDQSGKIWLEILKSRITSYARGYELESVCHWLAEAEPGWREAICLDLLRWVRQRGADRVPSSVSFSFPKLLGALWPPGGDVRALLEVVLGLPLEQAAATEGEGQSREIFHWVANAFRQAPLDLSPVLDSVLPAHEAGYPGRWCALDSDLPVMLSRQVEPRVREVAERMIFSAERPSRWALEYLIGAGHEPDRDPPPRDLLRFALGDPRLRPLVFQPEALLIRVLPEVRAELRAGSLTLGEVLRVVTVTRDLWGTREPSEHRRPREELEAKRKQAATWLAPEALPGPLDRQEWDIVRELLRPRLKDRDFYKVLVYDPFPPLAEWNEEDERFFTELLGFCRSLTDNGWRSDLEYDLLFLFEYRPHERWLPLAEEILVSARGRRDTDILDQSVETLEAIHEALGRDFDPKRYAPAGPELSGWLDEPDDEEE